MTPRVHARCVRLLAPRIRRRAAAWSLVGLLGAVVLTASSPAYAQLTPQQLAGLKPKVTTILRQASAPSAEEKKIIDDYFTKSFFPSLASDDPIQRGQLAKNRKDLFTQLINIKGGSPDARNHLINLTMSNVGRLAIGNNHPAVRYNAVLIIAQLDKDIPATASTPPTPLPQATKALVALLENKEFNKIPVPSAVKVAALIGLDRHTRFIVDPQYAEPITKAALAVATRTETPDDVSPEVDDWMRRLAFRVLANQFGAGLTAPVNDAVAKFLANKKVNLDDRCGVAELLKKEMYPAGQAVDPAPVALALGSLAKDVLTFEAKEANAYRKAMSGEAGASIASPMMRGSGGRGYGGEMGMGPGMGMDFGASPLADDGTKFKKRRMLERLNALRTAATALANAGGSDEVKTRMTDLAVPLKTAFDLGVKADTPDLDVAKAVIVASNEVNSLVSKWIPAEEPDAEAEDEEPFADAPAEAAEAPAAEDEAPAEDAAPAEAPVAEPAAPEAEAPVAADAPVN